MSKTNTAAKIDIGKHLINAYSGYYEDDPRELNGLTIRQKILMDSADERLRVYCEWNGIIGYHDTLFSISTGDLALQ